MMDPEDSDSNPCSPPSLQIKSRLEENQKKGTSMKRRASDVKVTVFCIPCEKHLKQKYVQEHIYRHLGREEEIYRFRCLHQVCTYKCSSRQGLEKHGLAVHRNKDCGKDFRDEIKKEYAEMYQKCVGRIPSRHLTKHGPEIQFEEREQQKQVEGEGEENGGNDSVNETENTPQGNSRTFKCALCERTELCIYIQRHVRHHLQEHMDLDPFECQICNMKFPYRNVATRHARSAHESEACIVDNSLEIKNSSEDMTKACTGGVLNRKRKRVSQAEQLETHQEKPNKTRRSLAGKQRADDLMEPMQIYVESNQQRESLETTPPAEPSRSFLTKEAVSIEDSLMMLDNFLPSPKLASDENTISDPEGLIEKIETSFENWSAPLEYKCNNVTVVNSCDVPQVPKPETTKEDDEIQFLGHVSMYDSYQNARIDTVPIVNYYPIDEFSPYYVNDDWSNEELYQNMAIVAGKMGRTQKQINAIINVVRKNKLSVVSLLFEDENLSAFFEENKEPVVIRQEIIKILTAMKFQRARDD